MSADHQIVDGAPLARFVARLRELIEAGDGLAAAVAPASDSTWTGVADIAK